MKPSPFDYVAAQSVEHVVDLLSSERETKVLAGGQSLMPVMNLRLGRADVLVDIGRIEELRTIDVIGSDAATLRIGAAVTQAEASDHRAVRDRWPLVADALAHIGHLQIRNRGTVCGSLAHNDPQAELPAVAIALDATLIARSASGERSIAADDFFLGPFTTALADDELLIAVEFPGLPGAHGWSFREFAPRPGDFATAGIVVSLRRRSSAVECRFVGFALEGGPTRATGIERAISAGPGPEVEAAVDDWLATLDPVDESPTSARSRLRHARVLALAALDEAWERLA